MLTRYFEGEETGEPTDGRVAHLQAHNYSSRKYCDHMHGRRRGEGRRERRSNTAPHKRQ